MKNLQVRVDEDEIEDLDELAQEMRLSRSEITRSALRGEALASRDLLGRFGITPPIEDEVFTGRESQPLREARGSWIEVVPVRGDRKGWTSPGLGLARHPCSRRRKATASSSTRSWHGP